MERDRPLRCLTRDRSGSTSLEFAITGLMALGLMLGMLYFGGYVYQAQQMQNLSWLVARYVMETTDVSSPPQVGSSLPQNGCTDASYFLNSPYNLAGSGNPSAVGPSGVTVCVTTANNSGVIVVTVTTSTPFTLSLPLGGPSASATMTGSSGDTDQSGPATVTGTYSNGAWTGSGTVVRTAQLQKLIP